MPLKDREARRRYTKEYNAKWRAANKQRASATDHAWKLANPAKAKASKKRYYQKNKPLVQARRRLAAGLPAPTRPQPKYCECCSRPASGKNMHLDHCHKTGYFRGWLCSPCNTGLGSLGDDMNGLTRAMLYLRRHTRRVIMPQD